MPSIFLVNDNKIVSRLLQLSSDKHNYLLEENAKIEPSKDSYDFVLVDSDKYTPSFVQEIQKKLTYKKLGYIGIKNDPVPDEFDMHLDKPFLPSDFVSMIEQNITDDDFVQTPTQLNNNEDQIEELSDVDEVDIEDLEELSLEDDLEELDAGNLDEKIDEPLEELDTLGDLDNLLDESTDEDLENLDLSLDSSSVMSTGVAEKFVQTPEDETNIEHEELANIIDEIEDIDDSNEITLEETAQTSDEKPTNQEQADTKESELGENLVKGALASGAAALAGSALLSDDKEEEISTTKDIDHTSLNSLEGAEALEQESDYIENASLNTDDLSDEIDTINEEEMSKALDTSAEQIITEEITHEGAEETLVETNDVQKWIQEAVAKAITPEMIKDALNDMQINITLDFSKKDT